MNVLRTAAVPLKVWPAIFRAVILPLTTVSVAASRQRKPLSSPNAAPGGLPFDSQVQTVEYGPVDTILKKRSAGSSPNVCVCRRQ